MHGERGKQAADVARVALRALRPGAVADELLEGGSALVAAEFVDRHGRSVPPWGAIGPAIRDATANARPVDATRETLLSARLRSQPCAGDTACVRADLRQARHRIATTSYKRAGEADVRKGDQRWTTSVQTSSVHGRRATSPSTSSTKRISAEASAWAPPARGCPRRL